MPAWLTSYQNILIFDGKCQLGNAIINAIVVDAVNISNLFNISVTCINNPQTITNLQSFFTISSNLLNQPSNFTNSLNALPIRNFPQVNEMYLPPPPSANTPNPLARVTNATSIYDSQSPQGLPPTAREC